MAVTSIPKHRLINLIIDDLCATNQATSHFNIQIHPLTDEHLKDRLMSFTKDELLTFITILGQEAENALHKLETSFPLRRPPTLYIAYVESSPKEQDVVPVARSLSRQGRKGEMRFDSKSTISFLYLPQLSVKTSKAKGVTVAEFQLKYGHRLEYVQADINEENYDQLVELYSLETAFVWLPLEKYKHAVIACCDYPALRRIRYFLESKLGIVLNSPYLDKGMLELITHGSVPRSVTYTLLPLIENENEIQHVTISDPLLQNKPMFRSIADPHIREQTSGFYVAHPGLAQGGIGIARRDGKVWTPRRLDHREIADLSVAIIEQTEKKLDELAKMGDFESLINYHYLSHVKLGDNEITGDAKETWRTLLLKVLEAQHNQLHEQDISLAQLNKLILHQEKLKLLSVIEYDCPSCNVRWLAKCSTCGQILSVSYGDDDIRAFCPKCYAVFTDRIECECGEIIEFDDLHSFVRIIPEDICNKSIQKAARRFNKQYRGIWCIQGYSLKYLESRRLITYPHLNLSDFQLWKTQGKLEYPIRVLKPDDVRSILNKTKEKCYREGTDPSDLKCTRCKDNQIRPEWIKNGETCLLRLFGIPVGKKFDGVHHGHEKADLRYQDELIDNHQQVNLWIHVKSRVKKCPPRGAGRKLQSIEGLYKQVVFSAFEAITRGDNVQVIGIAMPNSIKADVIESMSYAVNTLGFSFLVVDESVWEKIICSAYEQSEFDCISSNDSIKVLNQR